VVQDASGEEMPEVIALAEITEQAANQLRDALCDKYQVFSLDPLQPSDFHVAILYDSGLDVKRGIVTARMVPRGTRSMAYVDVAVSGYRLRVYGCHWAARFAEESKQTRVRLAEDLREHAFDFLSQKEDGGRHVLVLGDFNEEPYEIPKDYLFAGKEREWSRSPHWRDRETKKPRLYNCMWRFLGERQPHRGDESQQDSSGTYYWKEENRWVTFDQIIVSGSLLHFAPPFLDEGSVSVLTHSYLQEGPKSRPVKFNWNNGEPTGVSDHLPVRGSIQLC
jgi:endonuclease/exonuclease/phosphatase family metal-dependent hydrolase